MCQREVDARHEQRSIARQPRGGCRGLCGLEQIIVANGIKNTANVKQTASLSRIWGDNCAMVAKVATSDDPKEICLGRTWMFSG